MDIMDSKLNKLLQDLPQGAVATQAWLDRCGVYRQLAWQYVASGWMQQLGRGAFIRTGDSVDWLGAVYALQEQLGLHVHVAGETALLLRGHGRFLPLGRGQVVYLFGENGVRLPSWFSNAAWPERIEYRSPKLFESMDGLGVSAVEYKGFSVRVAAPERAMVEVLHLAGNNDALSHADELMSGLTTLRPELVQQLLEGCRSVKVKRYFLWSAETCGHHWFQKLNPDRIELGQGKRQLFKGGAYNAKYRITVPRKEGLPDV